MGVFPFTGYDDAAVQGRELPVFSEMAYDMETNRLKRRAGKTYQVYQDEALKIWIYLALQVERFRWPVYSWNYGNELHEIIGQTTNQDIAESEITRYITEALMTNPYIQQLSDFRFFRLKSGLSVQFTVTSIYGRFTWESEVYNE